MEYVLYPIPYRNSRVPFCSQMNPLAFCLSWRCRHKNPVLHQFLLLCWSVRPHFTEGLWSVRAFNCWHAHIYHPKVTPINFACTSDTLNSIFLKTKHWVIINDDKAILSFSDIWMQLVKHTSFLSTMHKCVMMHPVHNLHYLI